MRSVTQLGPPEGVRYNYIARLVSNTGVKTSCEKGTGILTIEPQIETQAVSIVTGADTNYDAKKATAEFGYFFKREDPGPAIEPRTTEAAAKTFEKSKTAHLEDFSLLTSQFELSLLDTLSSTQFETWNPTRRYNANDTAGDPYLERLLFDYGNYLFISSSRPGSLPPSLQGR
jgi:alpha-L-fucosidase 2